jgi:hypothetical protein
MHSAGWLSVGIALVCAAHPAEAQTVDFRTDDRQREWELVELESKRVQGALIVGHEVSPPDGILIRALSLPFLQLYELRLTSIDNTGVTLQSRLIQGTEASRAKLRAVLEKGFDPNQPLSLRVNVLFLGMVGAVSGNQPSYATFRLPPPPVRLTAPANMLGFPLLSFEMASDQGLVSVRVIR